MYLRSLTTAGLLAFALSACGQQASEETTSSAETPSESQEKTLAVVHRSNGAEPDTLDPHKSSGKWESDVIGEMIVGLATEAEDGSAVNGAATSFEVSEDGLTWTFKLDPDMNWSDGTPVTAQDFVYAHRRILDPKTAAQYASLIYVIKNAKAVNNGSAPLDALGVRAVDDKTLEYTLEYPAPYFFELSTHQTMAPVPMHVVEEHGNNWVKPDNHVVNGPFKLGEWVPNNYIKLIKNETFVQADSVALDVVYFYPIDDQPTEVKRYKAGELDITKSLPSTQIKALKNELGDQVRLNPYVATTYIQVNTLREPFTDKRVRRALALAVDRTILAEKILGAGQVPAYALVPPGMANYTNGAQMDFADKAMKERRTEAVALLEEAGFGPDNPLSFELKYSTSFDGQRMAVTMQNMWNTLGKDDGVWSSPGVKVTLFNSEAKVHYNFLRTQQFDLGMAGWVADYNDAENYLYLLQSTSGQMNYSQYKNEPYDALMAEAALTIDLDARALILQQAEQLILNDLPIIPLYYGATRHLVSPKIEGWTDNVQDWHRMRYIRFKD